MGKKKGETAPFTSKVTLFKVKQQYLKNALVFIRVCMSQFVSFCFFSFPFSLSLSFQLLWYCIGIPAFIYGEIRFKLVIVFFFKKKMDTTIPFCIFPPPLSLKDDAFIHPFCSSTYPPPIQTSEIDVLKVLHQHNALKADDYESIPQGGASALRRRPLVKEKMRGIVLCACFVCFFYVLVVWFLYIFWSETCNMRQKKQQRRRRKKVKQSIVHWPVLAGCSGSSTLAWQTHKQTVWRGNQTLALVFGLKVESPT